MANIAQAAAVVVIAFIAVEVPASAAFYWQNVNDRPFRRPAEEALKVLVKHGLPRDTIPELTQRIRAKKFTKGVLHKGEQCRAMVLGIGIVETNVVMDWRDVTTLNTEDYEVGLLVVRRATICNNILLCDRKTEPEPATVAPPAPASPPTSRPLAPSSPFPPTATLPTVALKEWHLIRIRGWRARDVATRLAEADGFQSRDLGQAIREAAAAKRVQPGQAADECADFQVEFTKAEFEKAHGAVFVRNGEPLTVLASFAPPHNAITVRVCGGEGTLRITTDWLTPEVEMRIFAPWGEDNRRYPPNGTLRTCSADEVRDKAARKATGCARFAAYGGSEFWGIVQAERSKDRTSNYHFAW